MQRGGDSLIFTAVHGLAAYSENLMLVFTFEFVIKLIVILIIFWDVTAFTLAQRYLLGDHWYILYFRTSMFFCTVALMSAMVVGRSESKYSANISAQAMWPWSRDYTNLYVVLWALVFRGIRIRKRSGFLFYRFKCMTRFQPCWEASNKELVSYCSTEMKFLSQFTGSFRLLVVKLMLKLGVERLWMIKSVHNGGNLKLEDQPLSGRHVTETQNFNWKM